QAITGEPERPERRRDRLAGLLASGAGGVGGRVSPEGAVELHSALLSVVMLEPAITAADVPHFVSALREVLDDDLVDRVIAGAARQLATMWATVMDQELAVRSALARFAECDTQARQSALSGLLDVPR